VAGIDVPASLKCGRCETRFSHHACSSGNIVTDEDTTALQTALCYLCALADPQVRIKWGKGLSMGIAPELAAFLLDSETLCACAALLPCLHGLVLLGLMDLKEHMPSCRDGSW
jgi:hypothetical protein